MKNFVRIFLIFVIFFLIINLMGFFIIKNTEIGIALIGKGIPIVRAVNEEIVGIKLISYVDIIKDKFMSESVFIELPEDIVELEKENIKENVIEEINNENESVPKLKSVTLDWKNEFKNNTKYNIDVEALKREKLAFNLKKSGTEVIIYHTHTTEAYTKGEEDKFNYSGDYRTLDKRYNVVNVGERVKDIMVEKGYGVYHEQEIYDYPSYNLSYSKAGKAIEALVKKYNKTSVVLDIHRDALGNGDEVYRPIININGKDVAQILLVIGSNEGGLSHSNWRENLKFALKIQQIANERYPGLMRYVILRKERFNQHVAPGAIIVEMGATGNTMEEVLRSADLFTEVLVDIIE